MYPIQQRLAPNSILGLRGREVAFCQWVRGIGGGGGRGSRGWYRGRGWGRVSASV
jgi:hypothetical protein